MTRHVKVTASGVAVVAAFVLGVASLAWACSPSAYISVGPSAAPAGSRVTVEGRNFENERVEIRWNGIDGPLLGAATGPSFRVQVPTPAAAKPGVYYVVAVANAGKGSAPFEVAESTSSTGDTETSESGGTTSRTATGGSGSTSGTQSGSTGGSGAGAPSGSASGTPQTSPAPGDTDRSPTPAGSRVPSSQKAAGPAAARQPAGSSAVVPVRRESIAPGAEATASDVEASAPESPPSAADEDLRAAPSPRTLTADLWSGFGDRAAGGPSLTSSAPAEPAADGDALKIGIALLAVGSVILTAGFGVAGSRRRRALGETGQ